MLSTIIPYLDDSETRTFSAYNQFLTAQREYIKSEVVKLISYNGFASPGIRLLTSILERVDIDELKSLPDNYSRYLNCVEDLYRRLKPMFDKSTQGHTFSDMFVSDYEIPITEYLIPVADVGSITRLPFDSEDWSIWGRVHPLCLLSHDSDEFTLRIMNDRIRFYRDKPTYAVEILDVIGLIFKYFIWITKVYEPRKINEENPATPTQIFLHRHVISHLLWDLSDKWLMSILKNLATSDNVSIRSLQLKYMHVNKMYGRIVSQFDAAIEELWSSIIDARRGLNPRIFLATKLLFTGSINDKIRYVHGQLPISEHRSYTWMRWLKERDLVNLYLAILLLRPGLPSVKQVLGRLKRSLNSTLRDRSWSNCDSIIVKNSVQYELEELLGTLNDLKL